jgi:hypothetical protein
MSVMGWLIVVAIGVGICAGITYILVYHLHMVPSLRAQGQPVMPLDFAANCRRYYELKGKQGRALKALMIALWSLFFLACLMIFTMLIIAFAHTKEINQSINQSQ